MTNINNPDPSEDSYAPKETTDRPAQTLLRSWGKRMAKGSAMVVPVFVGGAWSLQIPRGNKRVLRVAVPGKKT